MKIVIEIPNKNIENRVIGFLKRNLITYSIEQKWLLKDETNKEVQENVNRRIESVQFRT